MRHNVTQVGALICYISDTPLRRIYYNVITAPMINERRHFVTCDNCARAGEFTAPRAAPRPVSFVLQF